jgi:hypothetical protein
MPRSLTQVDASSRKAAIAAYRSGVSLVEAAQQGGVSVWLLRRFLKEDGVPSHPASKRLKISDPAIRAEIVRRYIAGESAAWLAEVYCCSHGCISKILTDSGTQLRNRDKARPYGLEWIDRKGRAFYMRSSWEVKVGYWLDSQGKSWDYEVQSFDVGDHTYTPDFWIYDSAGAMERLVDVKGQWTNRSRSVVTEFRRLYPEMPFEIWDKPLLVERGILALAPNACPMGPGPKFRMRRELRKQIIDLYQSGLSTKKVGRLVGRSSQSIKVFLHKSGLMRTMSEAALLRHRASALKQGKVA